MEKKKSLFTGLLLGTGILIGFFVFVLFSLGIATNESAMGSVRNSGFGFSPVYHVQLFRPGEGIIYDEIVGNNITDDGLNLIRDKFVSSDGAAAGTNPANVTFIGLSNDSVQGGVTSTNLSAGLNADGNGAEFVTCGLTRVTGVPSFGENIAGNWSVSYKWTSTCDNINVWKFGVFNGTKAFVSATDLGDAMFSVGNFTANVSLQINDELTVNVSYQVSNAAPS